MSLIIYDSKLTDLCTNAKGLKVTSSAYIKSLESYSFSTRTLQCNVPLAVFALSTADINTELISLSACL